MIRKGLLVVLWFPVTICMLLVNLSLLAHTASANHEKLSATPMYDYQAAQLASPGTPQVLSAAVIAGDARTLLLQSFLERNKSPMAPYADVIVREADKNDIDFRLITAIAMCESNVGKRIPSRDSYNAWGIAVYTGAKSGKNFDDWEHAIAWVSRYIKERYFDQGITNLRGMAERWAPPSVTNGHSWANCVEEFQSSIF